MIYFFAFSSLELHFCSSLSYVKIAVIRKKVNEIHDAHPNLQGPVISRNFNCQIKLLLSIFERLQSLGVADKAYSEADAKIVQQYIRGNEKVC